MEEVLTDTELRDAAIAHLESAIGLLEQMGQQQAAPTYLADFETGDLSQVHSTGALQQSSSGRISVSTSGPLEGAYSALIKNSASDYPVASGQRTEINFGTISAFCFGGGSLQGKETWAEWKVRLDANFEITSSGFCIITQFHGGTGSPVFAIEADPPAGTGILYYVARGGAVNANYRTVQIANPVPKGQTLHFKVYRLWSTSGTGRSKLWLNGALAVDESGPNLYTGNESAPYHKGGIYRSSGLTTRESQLLYDGVRWYTSDPGW